MGDVKEGGPQLLKETDDSGACMTHVSGTEGLDRTLCGWAYEGLGDGRELEWTAKGKIDCPDCLRIISLCKTIPRRLLSHRETKP